MPDPAKSSEAWGPETVAVQQALGSVSLLGANAATPERPGVRCPLEAELGVRVGAVGLVGVQGLTVQRIVEELAVISVVSLGFLGFVLRRQSRLKAEYRLIEGVYREAIGAAGAVPYRKDIATNLYAFMGDGIEGITGYPAHEMTPTLWRSLILEEAERGGSGPEHPPPVARQKGVGGPLLWRCDLRIRTRSGEERWVADSSTQVLGRDGRPTAWVGMLQDITETKRMEERSTQRRQVLELIATGAPLAAALEAVATLWENHIAGSTCCIAVANAAGRLEFLNMRRAAAELRACPACFGPAILDRWSVHQNRAVERVPDAFTASEPWQVGLDATGADGVGVLSWSMPIDGVEKQLLGVVCCCADRAKLLDAKESDTARLVVSLARLAIERHRNNEALQGRTKRLAEVNKRLVELARSSHIGGGAWEESVREITEAGARAIQVARVGIWLLTSGGEELCCEDRFELDTGRHESGERLSVARYPAYFNACGLSRIIAVRQTAIDPRTEELRKDYLARHGIVSLLDAPIRQAGRLLGVFSFEHTGLAREWTPEEEVFAASCADFVVLAIEARERCRAEALVRQLNVDLERRVEERTRQLSQANAELARAAKLKDESLTNMSHELRTPLVSILGLTEALQTDSPGALNTCQRHYLRTIEESGRHLLQLINDALDVAKSQAGRIRLQLDLCDVGGVCESALRLVKESALAKGQILSVTVRPPGVSCVADARRLKQILVNLLSNAVKFTPRGGRLGLAVEGDEANRVLRFTVWDTGVGIAAEDLPRVFQPFVQAGERLSHTPAGTGLGLVLVRRMAELHGGHVHATSTPGTGSRFSVVLPWRTRLETECGLRDGLDTEGPPPGSAVHA